MPIRNVVLTDHHEKVIDDLVRSGRYHDANEVLRDGLRLLERRESEDAARLEALRAAANKGIEAFERGEYKSFDTAAELEDHLVELGETAIARRRRRDCTGLQRHLPDPTWSSILTDHTQRTLPHRRRPVPMAPWIPACAGKTIE